ncbi:hypothetical protein I4U23_004816 [Adineta vaga]|nr:hypothetical protein I4U23_004816 [Adineta vaga]
MEFDQQLFINELSLIKSNKYIDELNLTSKYSTGTINDENDKDLNINIVQCLNEEVHSVRPFIQTTNDDQIIEGSLLNVNQWNKLISWNVKNLNKHWKLLYQGSRDGFHSKDFHRLCDDQGPTITVIRTKQGYISIKYPLIDRHSKYSVWNSPTYGPTFGRGADLFICSESNLIGESYSKFPSSYRDTTGLGWKSLSGKQQFLIDEIEIYH